MPEAATPAPLTALIVDDEPVARAGLRHALAEIEWLRAVGEAANGPAAIELIERLRPDIVFLDIQLPGMSGIEVLQRLHHRPCVVFTTAYAEHAVTAFELGALDYLLKPFGPDRLRSALDRVAAALGEPGPSALERLADAWGQGPIRRLFVRNGRAIVPLAVDRIAWFEALGDYVGAQPAAPGAAAQVLHVALARLEHRLDPDRFVRIHRTHIVNLDHLATFRRQLDGQLVAVMNNGVALPVSRAKAQVLRGLAR